MAWVVSNAGGGGDYAWSGLNTYNQHAAKITLPVACAVNELRVIAAGYNTGVVPTRLVIWNAAGAMIQQTYNFNMADGSSATQYTYEKTITPAILAAGDYWVGLYRDPAESHVMHVVAGSGNGFKKTNTAGFPAVVTMASYTTDTNDEPTVGAFYVTKPAQVDTVVATRVSDSQQNLTWNNNVTTDAPYDALYVERYDSVTAAYYAIATLAGTATSYNDTTTAANGYYRYRIRAGNDYTYGNYVASNYINTTPAAPTNVVATRIGGNVQLTWTDNAINEDNYAIARRESVDGGLTWGAWDYATMADPAANATSATDVAPYTYGMYAIRAEETADSLNSLYANSNDVVTIAQPDEPTGLAPDALTYDAVNAYTFEWNHNDTDGTAQTKYSLQYRIKGAAWPGTPQHNEAVVTNEYISIAGATFTNGNIYEWQVKTKGEHADFSDWSDTAEFTATSIPVGTITDPTTIADYAYSELTVEWTYTQAESNSQAQYLCKLFDEFGSLLESKQVSSVVAAGATDSCTFDYSLSNTTEYIVTLQVQESDGLWGAETEVDTFTTAFLEPTQPVITLSLDREAGSILVKIVNPAVVVDYNEVANQDSNVSLDSPDSNFEGSGELLVENDTVAATSIITTLLDFDLSFFVGKTIVSADLKLYRKVGLAVGIESAVQYIDAAWVASTVTYNTIPSLNATQYDNHAHTALGGIETWDLETFMDDIADGTIADYEGLAIVVTTTDGSVDTFFDNTIDGFEPVLTVEISPLNAETDYNKVYRSIAGGTWELIKTDITKNTTITDYTPSVGGNDNYYAQAVSTTPSINNSAEVSLDVKLTGMYFINGGSGFEEVVRLVGDISLTEMPDRDQTYKQYAGRTYPIKYQGNSKSQDLVFSADCPIAKRSDLIDIIQYVGDIFYRDWRGRWFYCMLQSPSFDLKDNLAYQFRTNIIRLETE